jgi:RNA polymerase sigma-70 factor (ECF subfamily)
MPDEPECAGLLALVLATHARRDARVDGDGELVLLADQDRSRWDHGAIAEAAELIEATLRRRRPGPYQVQAAIAALHGLAPSFAETDWPQIVELYRLLEGYQPTPVVRVNRAVAEAEAAGPAVGLAVLEALDADQRTAVEAWHLYWATRADLHRRLGQRATAAADYRRALDCPTNDSDRRFLLGRLAEVEAGPEPAPGGQALNTRSQASAVNASAGSTSGPSSAA